MFHFKNKTLSVSLTHSKFPSTKHSQSFISLEFTAKNVWQFTEAQLERHLAAAGSQKYSTCLLKHRNKWVLQEIKADSHINLVQLL